MCSKNDSKGYLGFNFHNKKVAMLFFNKNMYLKSYKTVNRNAAEALNSTLWTPLKLAIMGFRMKSEKLRFRKANHRAINIFENQTSLQEVNFRLMCQIMKTLKYAASTLRSGSAFKRKDVSLTPE